MEINPSIAIAREAAMLAFLCKHGFKPGAETSIAVASESPFDQERAELLASIRREIQVYGNTAEYDVRRDVWREMLTHLAAGLEFHNEAAALTVQ